MFARAPASSANLGPGFDTLAVALSLYVEVTLELADELSIVSEGCGGGRFDDERHLGVRVAAGVLGHTNFAMRVTSTIPLARGLGSSAALAIAAALDGHGENAAASTLGGLVVAQFSPRDGVVARSLPLDDAWRFVVVVPETELSTADARRVLPSEVPFADAVANLNAMGLLIAGLGNHHEFVASSMNDALHQPHRNGLLEYAEGLLARLRESGAAASSWSGAGPTMLGLVTDSTADAVATAAKEFLHSHAIAGEVLVLDADRVGLVTR